MSDFLKRTITGGLFGVLIFGSLFAGSITFLMFYLGLMILALVEFCRLTDDKGIHIQKAAAFIVSSLFFLLIFGLSSGLIVMKWMSLIVIIPAVVMISELYRKKGRPFDNLVWTFYAIVYITLPLSLLNFLVFPGEIAAYRYTPHIVAGMFMLIMINDTVAYLVGVPLGRHRLFERISPKKSWEGTIGGAIAVLAAAFLMKTLFPLLDLKGWMGISVIVAILGVYGDLVESLFKRGIGVKDSGNMLPGHGGVLDRIDAWIFVIPAVWVYLNFIL